jgi:preprotein translocase SecE subunit
MAPWLEWLREAKLEVRKVIWPSQGIVRATVVRLLVGTVIVTGFVLLVDLVESNLLRVIVK